MQILQNSSVNFLDLNSNDKLSNLSKVDLLHLLRQLDTFYLTYRDDLDFSSHITFGAEIEYEGVDLKSAEDYIKAYNLDWKATDDKTIEYGGEFVSKILHDEPKTWQTLKQVCEFLKRNKVDTTINAGFHVHVGTHILGDNVNAWRKFAKLYTAYERVFMRFAYGDKINARPALARYAQPVGLGLLERRDALVEKSYLLGIKHYFGVLKDNKKSALNIRSFDFVNCIRDLNTIEFRAFNATVEETIIQNDIKVAVSMLIAALSSDLDEDFLDYKLNNLEKENLTFDDYLNECNNVSLQDAMEFADLIFNDNRSKMYFLKQYIKNFERTINKRMAVPARRLVA